MRSDSDRIIHRLKSVGLTRVNYQEPMARHTSWRVGGPAEFLATAETADGIREGAAVARSEGMPWLVLGGGSNILVADAGIQGLVILNRTKRTRLTTLDDCPVVESGSGVFFARLAMHTAKHGFAGLEWGVAIPGTVGAGVVNNAGAHGGSVQQSLVQAEAINQAGDVLQFLPADLGFAYRQSSIKRTDGLPITQSAMVITQAQFRLQTGNAARSVALIRELVEARQASQPISAPSAGSTFKNPESGSAGMYIDQAGLKGELEGGAMVSPKHGNFIVNTGSATATDILRLVRTVQSRVYEQVGVKLEPEVQLVGNWAGIDVQPGWALAEPSLP